MKAKNYYYRYEFSGEFSVPADNADEAAEKAEAELERIRHGGHYDECLLEHEGIKDIYGEEDAF